MPPDVFCARIDEVKKILHPESASEIVDISTCRKISELIVAEFFVMKGLGK